METFNTSIRWDLSNLLCGLDMEKYKNYLGSIKEKLIKVEEYSKTNTLNDGELIIISQAINKIESAESFYYCLTIENIDPSLLTSLNGTISALKSQVRFIISNLQENLSNMSENQFTVWSNKINQNSWIAELLKNVEITSREETIISNFARETLSGLEDLYGQVRNNLKVNLDHEGNEISFAEANNLSFSHPEQSKRHRVFRELNKTLETEANIFASIYNQMVGLRLNENKIRKVDYLEESLQLNGISKPSLNAMWDAVDSNIHDLSGYLRIKAEEVGKKNISWHELMTSSQEVSPQITFSQAIDGITKSLVNIDSSMCEFVKGVITKGWVDAEQRKTKSSGGFCAPFTPEGESRISLNYDNSIDSARRLAHELGHAWHFQQMKYVPSLWFSEDTFEMTMAETSSIFFETAFIDYVIQNTNDVTIKKAILGSKIERSLNYLMSIRGAFLFEKRFYEFRKNGQLDAKKMEELSLQFQEKAYGSSLSEYEPFVWIKYGQFYQANTPFYNYPYSFGFLLSIGLLKLAKTDESFNQKFKGFLSETGMLPLEQLIKKHFHLDLSQPEFWQQSVQRLIQDIEQYNQIS
ncbi:M3 family metallopeptidase [Sporosarcina limicola]|uniref:Oligoendopeptidase F n=1 Tax=Sporosarcina limicola TaxID=34101 RepID=A0A927MIN1_9BACL|nr:M3 family metallopeptidase [Sporosarcina limicola]MBE1554608.1 oligoendopeptidase F [Sporosarcina limicola]